MPERCSRRALCRRGGLGDAASAVEVDSGEGDAAALDVERDGVGDGGGALDRRLDGDLVGDVGDDPLQAVGHLGEEGSVGVAGGDTHGGATGEQRSDDPAAQETGAAEDGDDVGHWPNAMAETPGPFQRAARGPGGFATCRQ